MEYINILALLLFFIGLSLAIKYLWKGVDSEIKRLNSKVVLITGASSGLGEALAHVFYRAGCQLVLASRNENQLRRVQSDLIAIKMNITCYVPRIVKLDLENLNSFPKIIDDILHIHSHIDILINNGGISVRADVLTTNVEIFVKVMTINYFGAVALTKAVLSSMVRNRKGNIIFISSIQGKIALPNRSAYSASKHALQAFSDSLRAEMSKYDVKVTCISPGYINTNLSKNALTGNGKQYGRTDVSTSSGSSTEVMAQNIFRSILKNEKDVIFAQISGVAAFWLRFVCPPLYFWAMSRRADS